MRNLSLLTLLLTSVATTVANAQPYTPGYNGEGVYIIMGGGGPGNACQSAGKKAEVFQYEKLYTWVQFYPNAGSLMGSNGPVISYPGYTQQKIDRNYLPGVTGTQGGLVRTYKVVPSFGKVAGRGDYSDHETRIWPYLNSPYTNFSYAFKCYCGGATWAWSCGWYNSNSGIAF